MKDKLQMGGQCGATVQRGAGMGEQARADGYYTAVCRGADGAIKWADEIHNIVTTVGKNDLLDKYLKGSVYTQTVRMGLKAAGTAVVGDTQASHVGWLEVGLANAPTYTGSRKDVVMGSASAGSSVSPGQVFAITSSGTVAGCFINNGGSGTIDLTTGVLYSAGDFSGGSKTVTSGDSITVTYTATIT
jgi:hypothetical protein